MPRQIRWRIVLLHLGILFVSLMVLSILTVNHIRQYENARWQSDLLNTARRIEDQAQAYYIDSGEITQLSALANESSELMNIEVTFLDTEENFLASSLSPEQHSENTVILPAASAALANGEHTQINEQTLTAAVPVTKPNGETVGVVLLQAPHTFDRMDHARIFWLAITVFLIASLAVLILAVVLRDQSLKQAETLTIAAQQMSMGNFNNLKFDAAPPELSDLGQALQTMAHQLGTQIDTLTSERAKLSAILNQMTDGVIIADAKGLVQLLNPAAERLFQINQETGLGRSVVEVMRYHQLVDLWRSARKGERQSTMLEIGPQHLFLQVVGIPLKTSLPGSTMILFQDLTQLRRLETVRRDFISNVSHELRTPLASLKALAETLQEGALEDPPAARRFIFRMETEIDNLTQLVNELLELSRIESGKVPLSFHRIPPCDLLQPSFERMSLQAERAGIDLDMECQTRLPSVFADPDRITQVMINLIHNAIKFTPPGGRITVSAYQDGDHIVFFVKDTGVGIARKDLGRIFERFYKADRARTEGGTGLGLSIARHMIESHGGYIWAESGDDSGSTFYFTLPVARR